ncbi:restriction endonuclease subunit S [Mangrovihabitans endophyticus]|uniref:restriction endonuclease subunit S n=1 Tax=Mangrovihabitans endophyticus TaxID=1751298 RepID=UPI0016687291|nr:restriction endonuclease subunit S [Mangrovihabitans endophyticus]
MTSLPNDWRMARLDTIAEVRLGRQRSPKNHEGDQMRPYLRAANVDWDGLRLGDIKTMNFTDAEMEVYRLSKGDLLLNEASGSAREVGKPALWQDEITDCAFQNTLIRVRPKDIEPEFLLHYFRHAASVGKFAEASRGVGINHLGKEALASWQIPLPPAGERQRIVGLLDQAYELRIKRRQAITNLDGLTQALFIETFGTFGDPLRRTANLDSATLGELTSEFRYGTSVKSEDRGHPTLRIPNVVGGSLDVRDLKFVPVTPAELTRLRLRQGDLLFVRSNGNPEYVGRCAVFSEDLVSSSGHASDSFIYASYLIRARLHLDKVNPVYVREFLLGSTGRRSLRSSCKTSAGQYNINIDGLSGISIPVPPLLLQQEFAKRVEFIAELRERYTRQLSHLDGLFSALQHRAFRGEL